MAERKTNTSDLAERLQQVLTEMDLWTADPTLAVDTAAEQFYRETGFIAPGKSVPLEMAATQPDDARQRAYETWHLERRAQRHATIREAITALRQPPREPFDHVKWD